MSTQTEVTEAQVVAFLLAKKNELIELSGVKYASIRVESDGSGSAVKWIAYVDGTNTFSSATSVDAAIADQVALAAPLSRAKRAREQAAKLLAQAAALEATT
jgi:hypothetical protein